MHCLKKAIYAGIWGGLCPEWFVDDKNKPLQRHEGVLLEFVPVSSESSQPFDAMFEMRFSNGSKSKVHLHKQSVCKSSYSNEEIYSIAKPPTCVNSKRVDKQMKHSHKEQNSVGASRL